MSKIFNQISRVGVALIAILCSIQPLINAQNILINGDFSTGNDSGWGVSRNVNTTGSVAIINQEAVISDLINAQNRGRDYRFLQKLNSSQMDELIPGAKYRITFDARGGENERPIRMVFIKVSESGNNGAVEDIITNLSTTMSSYSTEFIMPTLGVEMNLEFELGNSNADVYIDNVTLERVEVVSDNFIENGEFDAGVVEPWTTYLLDGITATFSLSGQVGKFINISEAGTNTWDIQLYQSFSSEQLDRLESGEIYTIKFDAFGSGGNRPLRVFFGQDGGEFATEFMIDLQLTNEFQTFEFGFQLSNKYENMKLSFEAGTSSESIFFDNVEFFKGGVLTFIPEPPSDFALLSPSNNAILNQSPTLFEWEAASDDVDDSSTLAYQMYLASDPSFSNLIFTEPLIGSTSVSLNQELQIGEYYWKVDAIDSDGLQTWGSNSDVEPFSFRIEEALDSRPTEFVEPVTIGDALDAPRVIKAADFDNDSINDALLIAEGSVLWARNDGNGNFETPVVIDSYFGRYNRAVTADLDGDMDYDVVVLHNNGSEPIWWLENRINEGIGFSERQIIDLTGVNPETPTDIKIADLDNDSDYDLIVTYQRRFNNSSSEANRVVWYKNNGSGSFGEALTIHSANQFSNLTLPLSVAVADIDGDNMPDIVVGTSWGIIYLYVNNNNAESFSSQYVFNTSSEVGDAVDLRLADLDGDNLLDVLTTNNNTSELIWFKNMGAGSFAASQTITGNLEGAFEIDAGDYDADGDIDVAGASFWGNKVVWYENDGSGNFSDEFIISSTLEGAISISSADLNGDNYLDILAAANGNGTYTWYKNIERTATSNEGESTLPDRLILHQNYPNPFNPTTTIAYEIAGAGLVTMEVFNLLGQKVETLIHAQQSVGTYTIQFDASRLNSGIYILRINSGGLSTTRKMTLLK